ncbi:MAG TPA: DUF885 domain-containing protein [Chakrabartia sp.]|jgi:uncharacterized protein (DUF885 family)|nr:DUF885 domain-containing protein [Chakrabartia sp.]
MTGWTRRASLGALAALAAGPAYARRKKAGPPPDTGPFERIAAAILSATPETATYNGAPGSLDGGVLAQRMDNYSPEGEAGLRAAYQSGRDDLARLKLKADSPLATHLAVVSAVLENGTRSSGIPYGRINPLTFTGHVPYLVSQISGPHIDSLSVLMEQQSLSTTRAVDAWLGKLDSFPGAFANVVEKIRADRGSGCVPPRIVLERTLPVLDAMLRGPAEQQPLIAVLARRMEEAGLSRRTRQLAIRRATSIVQKRVRPAFQLLRQEIAALLPIGRPEAGVWAQPMGADLYAANVRALGDTLLSPDEIHRIGLDEVTRIAAEMNTLLAAQGQTQGSIGERMTALTTDPANQFADSPAGRDALLAFVRARVAEAEASYADWLPAALIPRQRLTVKAVPQATQNSAPGGYYDGPSLDGTRPGTYWINLRDMASVARFRLPTLSYHEGVPGHHTQSAIAAGLGGAPLLVRIASFNAYQEGWALYAERLMAERGVYAGDPLGDLGRLQDELFRAIRLVIDTGLHHKRWTREQAIRTMRDMTGIPEIRATAEVERYMAWPGQALGYKLGQMRLLEMRTAWLAKKGRDLKGFHGAVLGQGAMPLNVLQGVIQSL